MNRIDREKVTIGLMIGLYCRRREGNKVLCPACTDLLAYAHKRLDKCRFGNAKCACKKCPVHCYAPKYRAKIREVMRYIGPRIPFFHPIATFRHLLGS